MTNTKETLINTFQPLFVTPSVTDFRASLITVKRTLRFNQLFPKIRITEAVTGDYPVGSTATILYIGEMDNVFIEWSDGKLSSFSDKQVLKGFEKTGA